MLDLARALLGQRLVRGGVGGVIVETEAYHQREGACHAHGGRTARNASLFLGGGHLYVYRIHQSTCLNVVADPAGEGAAVLVRALRPELGREEIALRRAGRPEREWTNGPGKLCLALGVTLADDGARLGEDPADGVERVELCLGPGAEGGRVLRGPRVGISRAKALPWRFRLV